MARKKAEARRVEAPAGALAQARVALGRGNVRAARASLAEALAKGPEGEREEVRALLARTAPDPRALLTAAGVLLLILIAAWVAILRGSGG
jgi:hypothetical protein